MNKNKNKKCSIICLIQRERQQMNESKNTLINNVVLFLIICITRKCAMSICTNASRF